MGAKKNPPTGTRYIQTTSAPALRRVAEGCGEPMPSPLAAKPRLSTTDDDYDTAYVITVDSISELPDACDDDSYWYDDNYSYWYDDDRYDDQDWAPDVLQLVEVAVRDPEELSLIHI